MFQFHGNAFRNGQHPPVPGSCFKYTTLGYIKAKCCKLSKMYCSRLHSHVCLNIYCIPGNFCGMYISWLSIEPCRIFVVEISWMKVIQKFLHFSRHAMKNLCYYFKRDRQSSLPNSISHVQLRQSYTSLW